MQNTVERMPACKSINPETKQGSSFRADGHDSLPKTEFFPWGAPYSRDDTYVGAD